MIIAYSHCTNCLRSIKFCQVFNPSDCDKIKNEITGIMKMNTFIDIVLTKRPQAIGTFITFVLSKSSDFQNFDPFDRPFKELQNAFFSFIIE